MSPADISNLLAAVRSSRPLVHNITNFVVMNNTANALLAVGASPAMAHSSDEVEEFVGLAQGLVINIGTLSSDWAAAMRLAAARARQARVPWALDPVGVGATGYRSALAADLLRRGPAVIRANASEILALAGAAEGPTRGADTSHEADDAVGAARRLAAESGAVVAVTGATDYVTDGRRVVAIGNGDALMSRVTGLGCTATALVGAFLAVEPAPLDATVAALVVLGVAGELAAERAAGPGSLQMHLLDALHALDAGTLARRARLS